MCWATPSSADSSPIVLRAPGAFSAVAKRTSLPGDPVAHDLAGAEGHHAARGDRHFDTGLGVAADALALVAQDEGAETGDLHIAAVGKRVAHVVQHTLDHAGGFGARQAELAMHDVGQVGARQGTVGFSVVVVQPRDAEIGHSLSPVLSDEAPRRRFTFVTKSNRVDNSTFRRIA